MDIPLRANDPIEVRCARVPDSLPAGTIAGWIERLPKMRQSALAQRLAKGKGIESLTGLALLASLSSEFQLPSLDSLCWQSCGKPGFPEGPDFSIAHSAGFAACAIAPGRLRIGIDLESVHRVRKEAVRLVANEEELDALENGSCIAAELWTAKEAVLKASGAVLSDIRRVQVHGDHAHFDGVEFHLRCCPLVGGLLLTIALERPIQEPVIDWRSPEDLFGVEPRAA
jgi:phosphopantetheinyl transferase